MSIDSAQDFSYDPASATLSAPYIAPAYQLNLSSGAGIADESNLTGTQGQVLSSDVDNVGGVLWIDSVSAVSPGSNINVDSTVPSAPVVRFDLPTTDTNVDTGGAIPFKTDGTASNTILTYDTRPAGSGQAFSYNPSTTTMTVGNAKIISIIDYFDSKGIEGQILTSLGNEGMGWSNPNIRSGLAQVTSVGYSNYYIATPPGAITSSNTPVITLLQQPDATPQRWIVYSSPVLAGDGNWYIEVNFDGETTGTTAVISWGILNTTVTPSTALYSLPYAVSYMAVGGGGGGGSNNIAFPGFPGGGGYGGQVIQSTFTVTTGNTYTVTIGGGGSGGSAGTNTSAFFTDALGGLTGNVATIPTYGADGGDGGYDVNAGDSGLVTGNGGDGGAGVLNTFFNDNRYYGGGGGGAGYEGNYGGNYYSTPAKNAGGGVGDGTEAINSGTNGSNGFGGGGGGSRNYPLYSYNGGNGVVIMSIPTANYTSNTTGSPAVTVVGTSTILTFTSNGSYIA